MAKTIRPDHDSRFVGIGGLRIHYKRAGAGPVLLLLHGSASSLHCFDGVSAMLERTFDVVRLDLPGFGLTGPRADRNYTIEAFSRAVRDFMDALSVERYAVAGNSLGGNIAWNLALDDRARLRAAVLINATGYPEKSLPGGIRAAQNPWLKPLLRRWLPRGATARSLRQAVGPSSAIVNDAMIDRLHGLMSLPGNRSAFVDLANTKQRDRSAEIQKIRLPVLVLRSASIDGQHFARDILGSSELVHPAGGHLLPEEDPAWVARAIGEFLTSPSSSATSHALRGDK